MSTQLELLRRRGLRAFVVEFGLLGFSPLFMVGYIGCQILLRGSVTYTLRPFLLDAAVFIAVGVLWALTMWGLVVVRRTPGQASSP